VSGQRRAAAGSRSHGYSARLLGHRRGISQSDRGGTAEQRDEQAPFVDRSVADGLRVKYVWIGAKVPK